MPQQSELTRLEHNKNCREEAEEIIQFCGARPARFWEELIRLAGEKLPGKSAAPAGPTDSNPIPPHCRPSARFRSSTAGTTDRADKALAILDQINELVEEVPERGQEWAQDAAATANSIGESIEAGGNATDKQYEALANIRDAMSRWIR